MAAKRTTIILATITGFSCTDFSIDDSDLGAARPTVVEETFLQDPTPRVDILWMMDNTSSMETEQAHLVTAIEAFIDELDNHSVSWHLGVITPDGQGVLRGNPWVFTTENTAIDILSDTLNVGLDGSLPQTGLAAIASALNEPLLSTANRGFRRDNAALHTVVYSDGDDQSDGLLGSDPVETFLAFLAEEQTRTGLPAIMSSIVGPATSGCIGPNGGATAGERYVAVAERSEGSITSICNPDLRAIAEDVTNVGTSLSSQFTLQARPQAGTVRVAIDGLRIDDGWTVDEQTVQFSTPPNYGETITVRYRVAG